MAIRVIKIILFVTSLMVVSYNSPVSSEDFETRHRHRNIRSPQLFSGRNVLTDLTQFKPPSLNDLQEFRQRMASLANFTAILEQAVAVEKAARSTLQGFVNSLRDQVLGVQKAVNPDPENYWDESKTCGGIIVSQTGRIIYKLHDFYQNHERCTWTVRANQRSKIKVTLTEQGLEDDSDFVAVTYLPNLESPCETIWKTNKLQEGRTELVDGPLIFITFFADGSVRKKGFRVEFEGLGTNRYSDLEFEHFHFTNASGGIDISKLANENRDGYRNGDKNTFKTVVLNPSNWNSSILRFSVAEDSLSGHNSDTCNKTSILVSSTFPLHTAGNFKGCVSPTCTIDSDSGLVLVVVRHMPSTSPSQLHVNWTTEYNDNRPPQLDDTCGGVLTDRFGRLRYKANKPYANNENCLWIIQPEEMKEGEAKVQLINDGFEEKYDYVTVSYLTVGKNITEFVTKILYKNGNPLRIPSPYIIVQFYTDSATFGKPLGFELIWEIQQTSGEDIDLAISYENHERGTKSLSCPSPPTHSKKQLLFIQTSKNTQSNELSLQSTLQASRNMEFFVGQSGMLGKSINSNDVTSTDGILALLWHCPLDTEITVDWETVDVNSSSSVSSESTHVTSEDECGDYLFGDSGQIVYKIGKEYKVDERCTWVIRPKRFSAITVQLMADGFESCCDGVQINKIDMTNGMLDPNGITISRENRFRTLEASALLVTFLSDNSVTGTGFVLEFQTKGSPVQASDIGVDLKHWHLALDAQPTTENPLGPIFIQTSQNLLSVDTFSMQHLEAFNNISVVTQVDDLELNGCNHDSVAFYHMPNMGEYELLDRKPSYQLCQVTSGTNSDPITLLHPSMRMKLKPKGVLLSITKIKSDNADKSVSFTFQ